MTFEFRRFGTLVWFRGIPFYVSGRVITPHGLVWWWPWNWVVIAAVYIMDTAKKLWRKVAK